MSTKSNIIRPHFLHIIILHIESYLYIIWNINIIIMKFTRKNSTTFLNKYTDIIVTICLLKKSLYFFYLWQWYPNGLQIIFPCLPQVTKVKVFIFNQYILCLLSNFELITELFNFIFITLKRDKLNSYSF